MNVEIFTVENRTDLIPLVERSAQDVEQFTGIPTTVITPRIFDFGGLKYPSFAKAWIWSIAKPNTKKIVYVDSDVVMIRPFRDLENMNNAFYACEDICNYLDADLGLPKVSSYFNAGVFVCSRASEPMFQKLQEALTAETRSDYMYEQHWFNVLVHQMLGGYTKLNPIYNWLACTGSPPKDVINLHFAGGGESGVCYATRGREFFLGAT